jgi:hypothetical protein
LPSLARKRKGFTGTNGLAALGEALCGLGTVFGSPLAGLTLA